jgi:hypothetical protein
MHSARKVLTVVLAFQVSSISAHCEDAKDSWQSIRQLPRRANFMFMERDLICHFGQVTEVTNQNVVVHGDKSDIKIERSNLLYIQRWNPSYNSNNASNYAYRALTVMYSGRSAWSDIVGFMPFVSKNPSFEVRMSVATTTGKLWKGSLKEVTETGIILRNSLGTETQIPKMEVSSVDYIRSKPLSDDQEFDWDELAMLRIFDPVLYPRMFHLGDTFSVRLYDRAVPEDNSPVQCR